MLIIRTNFFIKVRTAEMEGMREMHICDNSSSSRDGLNEITWKYVLLVEMLLDIFLRNIILRNGLIPTRLFIDKNLSLSRREILYS